MWAAAGGLLLFCGPAAAPPPPSVVLAWDPSPGTDVITNYTVYYGLVSRTYIGATNAGLALTVTVTNLTRGPTWYFAATATDTNGLQSDYSSEVFTNIPVSPNSPTNLRIRLGP